MSNVIYVDILLMINLLVNFLMLSAAGLLVKTPTRSWRILLSAAIGAVYSLIKYSLQGTTQGRYLTGGVPPVRFSM